MTSSFSFDACPLPSDLVGVDTPPDKPLTILLFAAGWNPAAMFVAEALRDLRDARDLNFATVLIVDTWDEAFEGKGWAVPVTPAITFLCKGRVLTIRRPGWSDADQFVGAVSKSNLLEICRHVDDMAAAGRAVINCEY